MIPSYNAGLASARRLLPPKPRTAFLILLVLAVLAWPGRSHAKKQLPPRGPNLARPAVCIAPTSAPPQVDGLLTDACWSSAVVVRPFHLSYEGGWPPYRTEAALTYDAANLYVGLRTLDPDRRVHAPLPWPPDRDPSVAELLVDAGMEEAFYKVAVTSAAEVHVTQPMANVVPWRQGVTAAMKPFAGGWVAEFAIPFAAVDLPAPGPTCTWRVNLGWRTPKCVGYSSWAVTHAWFYEPQYYGDLHFGGPHALTAELTEVTAPQPGRNPLKIVLRNRGAAAAECEVLVTLADRTGARVVFQQFVPVPGDGGTDVAADYTLPDGLDDAPPAPSTPGLPS